MMEPERNPATLKQRTTSLPKYLAFWGALGLFIDVGLIATYLFYVFSAQPPPLWVPFLLTFVAFVSLFAILLSFVTKPSGDSKTRGRVTFAGFFGYVIVVSVIGTLLLGSARLDTPPATGWSTSEIAWPDMLVVRLQTFSSIEVPPFHDRLISLTLFAFHSVINSSITSIDGTITIGFQVLQPPLVQTFPATLVLDGTADSGILRYSFNPTGGVRAGNYNVTFFVEFNISVPGVGNYSAVETGTLVIRIQDSELASTWYLVFILIGILTSFWWRIANGYLGGGDPFPNFKGDNRERLIVAYILVVPAFSGVIALVIFGDFLRSLTPGADALTRIISGFFFGFFWENAAKKLGESVSGAYKKLAGREAD